MVSYLGHAKRLKDLEAARRLSERGSWSGDGPAAASDEERLVMAQVYDAADYLQLMHLKEARRSR